MPLGKRQVVDLAAEVSFHLIEPVFLQSLSSSLAAGVAVNILLTPASPQPATTFLYPGALVVVGWHVTTAEVVSVIAITGPSSFTANLTNNHNIGEQVFGATFPTQVPTDPIFTQPEILGYIAQAQNEFLTKVPLIFQFLPFQELIIGQAYQTLPSNLVIELERVSVESLPASSTFQLASISRLADVVTATLTTSSLADQWTPGLEIYVFDVADPSYNSTGNLPELASVSPDGLTITWNQTGPDSSSTGGIVVRPTYTRLYESAQEQIDLNLPWQSGLPGPTIPVAWFEDRTGTYGWGVAPPPPSNFYVELLASVRGNEALGMLDYFMVPDIFVYAIKWRVLAYAWSKDGIQRSPTLERFAKGKFDFYCMLADRFLRNVMEKTGKAGAMMGGMF